MPYTTAGQGWPEPSPYDAVMLDRKVRFVGDRVAVVAAEDPELRAEGVRGDRGRVRGRCPRVFDPERAMDAGAPRHPRPGRTPPASRTRRATWPRRSWPRWATSQQGFAEAERVFEATYRVPYVQQASIEPHIAITWLDEDHRLMVRTSTQVPFHVRRIIAPLLGIPVRRIRVIKPRIGGGFGGKQEILIEDLCGMLTLRTGRPVRLEYTREEELTAARTRHPQILTVKSGVKDGRFTAIEMKVLENTGAYGTHALTVMSVTGNRALSLYRCPNVRYEARAVYTNLAVAGAFRGYGCPQGFFALESHVDEVAHGARAWTRWSSAGGTTCRRATTSRSRRCWARGGRASSRSSAPAACPRRSSSGAKAIGWSEEARSAEEGGDGTRSSPRRGHGDRDAGVGHPRRGHGRRVDQDERGRLVQPADGRHRHRHRLRHHVLPGGGGDAGRARREDHPVLVRHRHDAVRPGRLRVVHDVHLGPRGREGGARGAASRSRRSAARMLEEEPEGRSSRTTRRSARRTGAS